MFTLLAIRKGLIMIKKIYIFDYFTEDTKLNIILNIKSELI